MYIVPASWFDIGTHAKSIYSIFSPKQTLQAHSSYLMYLYLSKTFYGLTLQAQMHQIAIFFTAGGLKKPQSQIIKYLSL